MTRQVAYGQTDIGTCHQLLVELLTAKHAPKAIKEQFLIKAHAQAEVLSLQIRMILELKLANDTNCLKLQAKLTEVQRMLGGWLKSVRS